MAYCLPTWPQFYCKFKFVPPSTCPHHCQEICQSSCPAHCCASQHVSTMEHSQSIQELCPTICSSSWLPSCPFFVVRCLRRCQAHVQAVALWAAFCHANDIVVKSTILLIFRHSHLQPVHHPSQCAIHCDDMCPAHCSPLSSSEQSSFLTKSIPTENVQPNFLLPQSYATPTPYAPVFPRTTVHTVGSSIVVSGDKSLHTYSKPRWGYRAVRERPTLWSLLTNLCSRTTYRGDCRACWWTPDGARGKTVFGTSNKWENLASRAASLSLLFLLFSFCYFLCRVTQYVYFLISRLWCYRKDCQIKSLSDVSPQVTKSIIGM